MIFLRYRTVPLVFAFLCCLHLSAQAPGDADGNGRFDLGDLTAINNHIHGNATAPGNPDCNGDGDVTVHDIVCLSNLLQQQGGVLPLDPATIAPAVNRTIATPFAAATAFLFSGENPIQTGVQNGALDAERLAVMRGLVRDQNGNPIPGVTVRVNGNDAFGSTQTRADGVYDLALNAGEGLSLRFEKAGYISVFRRVDPRKQSFDWLDEVILTAYDTIVTPIDLASADTIQVAQSSQVTDDDGSRTATMMFHPGTEAEMVLPSGEKRTLATINVRATEYTVGPDGPKAMPAHLPTGTAYTYCIELSADEAIGADAGTIKFSQPVSFYVDNFLNLPVGIIVPSGYFDRNKGAWIAAENGRIIAVIDIVDGKARLDVSGDGTPADAAALKPLGIDDAELAQIAARFQPGAQLQRVRIDHFTPYDLNYGQMLPPTAVEPELPEEEEEEEEEPCGEAGSIIDVHNQTLGESINIFGSGYSLFYNSARVPGRRLANELEIALTGTEIPDDLRKVELEVEVAGQRHRFSFDPAANLSHTFVWDGRDGYGRLLQGRQTAVIRIGYTYTSLLQMPADTPRSFGTFGDGNPVTANAARGEITLWQEQTRKVGAWDARATGFGGWTVDVHHTYDPFTGTLYRGDGTVRSAQSVPYYVTAYAGTGEAGYTGDGGAATHATLNAPQAIEMDQRGNLYIVELHNHAVRQVTPGGRISTLVGTGEEGNIGTRTLPGDQVPLNLPWTVGADPRGGLFLADTHNNMIRKVENGLVRWIAGLDTSNSNTPGLNIGPDDVALATRARLNSPAGFAVDREGNLYFADKFNHKIMRIDREGYITLAAGNPERNDEGQIVPGFGGDGGSARYAQLYAPTDVAFDRQGNMYIADLANHVVRKVGRDGRISTVAGTGGRSGFGGDGGPATEALMTRPVMVEVDREGNLYIADSGNNRVRRVTPDGIISTVAGGGQVPQGDGEAAQAVRFPDVVGLTVSESGEIFISQSNNHQIYKISPPMPNYTGGELVIPSDDGVVYYVFDATGRHLKTVDALSNATSHTFGYTPDGRLATITDADNAVTRFNTVGSTVTITAPYGQETVVVLNDDGYAETIANAVGNHVAMTYDSGDAFGLLRSFQDFNGGIYRFEYDAQGRLTLDTDPEGGFKSLKRDENEDGYTITVTNAENVVTKYHLSVDSKGTVRRWNENDSCACPQSETVTEQNGRTTTTLRDGTTITQTAGSDPRWGTLVPMMKQTTMRTPDGLTVTTTAQKTVELSNPADPTSLTKQEESITVNGKTVTTSWDAATRTMTSRSATGIETVTVLNEKGDPRQTTRPGLEPVQYEYDDDGRVKRTVQGERITSYTYNEFGWLETITDPLNREKSMEVDAVGRVMTATRADSRTVSFEYDKNGNITGITPVDRPKYTRQFNDVDLEESETDAGEATTATVYRKDQMPREVTFADGGKLTFTYDTSGRLENLTGERLNVTTGYDPDSGMVSSLTSTTGPDLGFSYDGSLLTDITWTGAVAGTVGFTYNNDLSVTHERINGAHEVRFQYDDNGTLSHAGAMALSYHPTTGFLTGTTLGDTSATVDYNAYGEMDFHEVSHGVNLAFRQEVVRDHAGRITNLTETRDGGSSAYVYSYDDLGRLTDVTRDSVLIEHYDYDTNGNRTGVLGRTDIASYDDQDRITAYDQWDYGFDANGRLQRREHRVTNAIDVYDYDLLGNLNRVDLADGRTIEYIVDAANRRVGKRIDGVLVQGLLYTDALNPIAQLDGTGNVVARFVYGTYSNVPEYMVKDGKTYRIISDFRGSPRLVIDSSNGDVVQQLEYDSFGNVTTDSNPGFQPFGFAGGLYDADTGLTRFGARDYDAELGRWTDKDPLGLSAGMNLYVYCHNDPVNFIDPDGNFAITGTVLLAMAVGAAVDAVLDIAFQLYENSGNWDCVDWGEVALSAGLGALMGPILSKLAKASWFQKLVKGRGPKGGCFAAGTLVHTVDGLRPIEDLQPGDEVLAYDFNNGRVVAAEIEQTHLGRTETWILIDAGGERIVATREHPIWVEQTGDFVDAQDVKVGDTLFLANRRTLTVDAVTWITGETNWTFNLTVAGHYNYFVGEAGWLTHNQGGQTPPQLPGSVIYNQGGVRITHNYGNVGALPGTPVEHAPIHFHVTHNGKEYQVFASGDNLKNSDKLPRNIQQIFKDNRSKFRSIERRIGKWYKSLPKCK